MLPCPERVCRMPAATPVRLTSGGERRKDGCHGVAQRWSFGTLPPGGAFPSASALRSARMSPPPGIGEDPRDESARVDCCFQTIARRSRSGQSVRNPGYHRYALLPRAAR